MQRSRVIIVICSFRSKIPKDYLIFSFSRLAGFLSGRLGAFFTNNYLKVFFVSFFKIEDIFNSFLRLFEGDRLI
jgi:hypothetical protein